MLTAHSLMYYTWTAGDTYGADDATREVELAVPAADGICTRNDLDFVWRDLAR